MRGTIRLRWTIMHQHLVQTQEVVCPLCEEVERSWMEACQTVMQEVEVHGSVCHS